MMVMIHYLSEIGQEGVRKNVATERMHKVSERRGTWLPISRSLRSLTRPVPVCLFISRLPAPPGFLDPFREKETKAIPECFGTFLFALASEPTCTG